MNYTALSVFAAFIGLSALCVGAALYLMAPGFKRLHNKSH